MESRKIIVIVGEAATGKSALLGTLAAMNQKDVRTYGDLGVAHLHRKPYESEWDYPKRSEAAKTDSVLYIDDVYSRRRTPGETIAELLGKTGNRDLVLATQDEDLVLELSVLNTNTIIVRL